jgi:ribonuclease HI
MLKVFIDGSSRPNPGPSAVGVLVRDGDRDLHSESAHIGRASSR